MGRRPDRGRADVAGPRHRNGTFGRPNVPFLGNVVGNIVAMVNELGKNGIVGLIALGIILWLFSHRSVS